MDKFIKELTTDKTANDDSLKKREYVSSLHMEKNHKPAWHFEGSFAEDCQVGIHFLLVIIRRYTDYENVDGSLHYPTLS